MKLLHICWKLPWVKDFLFTLKLLVYSLFIFIIKQGKDWQGKELVS